MKPHRRLAIDALLLIVPFLLGAARQGLPQDDSGGGAVLESEFCARCHSNAAAASAMRDSGGHGIAPYDLWRSTMMANSARDPFWRASMSAEIAATPSRREDIERKCLRCHTPMASGVGLVDHGTGSLRHVLVCEERIGDLARDGVSCTICHGITEAGLGESESFTGRFTLDDRQRLFGPHEALFEMPMRRMSGFTPTAAGHMTRSALCATCHTLFTSALDSEGVAHGEVLLEQGPYLEWRNSAYDRERADPGPRAASCQSCHVPTRDEHGAVTATRIARNPMGRDFPPTRERTPFGRHLFVGGNALVLEMLRDGGEELDVLAPREAFDRTLERTREQLGERTARIGFDGLRREGGELAFEVEVTNLAGHKLPTGHPSRRLWLHVDVRDEAGELVFHSGGYDERGFLIGPDGRPLASELAGGPLPGHVDEVTEPGQVALYRAQMMDAEGAPTFTLLRGVGWLSDDRILPDGWSQAHPDAALTEPVGVEGDADFGPGGDRVHYRCTVDPTETLTVDVELCYQPAGTRWVNELLRWGTDEIEAFRTRWEAADRRPEILAQVSVRVPPTGGTAR